ncbi:hypothetical protein HPP92_001722 [Vanilla planifolia]|uniref:Uncharacterized protein n=1 Tax=Vanilla planifolia TaxID=51239 RepID=A0A835RZV2_VANPL|nr:hypothetical protein HPP92_001722 [Vanilla planifolia]
MSEAMTSPFCDPNPSYSPLPGGVFDFHGAVGGVDHGTLGFMDLLGLQDVSASLFDAVPIPIRSPLPAGLRESSEKVNLPATPNSSTMSSSSTEEANEADSVIPARDDDVGELDREKKRGSDSKEGMKKGQKRQREPRFAFVTKSEVDNGRWFPMAEVRSEGSQE